MPLTVLNGLEMCLNAKRQALQIDFAINLKGKSQGKCWLVAGYEWPGLQPAVQPRGLAGTCKCRSSGSWQHPAGPRWERTTAHPPRSLEPSPTSQLIALTGVRIPGRWGNTQCQG